MRARNIRPSFDRLDARLVLDASGADMVTGANLGAAILPIVSPDNGSSDLQAASDSFDWYLPGSPPPVASDPAALTVPWDLVN